MTSHHNCTTFLTNRKHHSFAHERASSGKRWTRSTSWPISFTQKVDNLIILWHLFDLRTFTFFQVMGIRIIISKYLLHGVHNYTKLVVYKFLPFTSFFLICLPRTFWNSLIFNKKKLFCMQKTCLQTFKYMIYYNWHCSFCLVNFYSLFSLKIHFYPKLANISVFVIK